MSDLKPCPFCGSDAVHTERSYFRDVLIYCENCDAYFTVDSFAADEKDVIEAWNRRAEPERTAKVINITHVRGYPAEGECGNCGYDVDDDGYYCPKCGAKLEWE